MSDTWRKEWRYQVLKDGKVVSTWQSKERAKQKAREFESMGHKTEIKKVEVEVMPVSLFNDIFGVN